MKEENQLKLLNNIITYTLNNSNFYVGDYFTINSVFRTNEGFLVDYNDYTIEVSYYKNIIIDKFMVTLDIFHEDGSNIEFNIILENDDPDLDFILGNIDFLKERYKEYEMKVYNNKINETTDLLNILFDSEE